MTPIVLIGLTDIELALGLIFFVWIFNWIKGQLGNPGLAIIIAAIVTYLTVFTNPGLIWLAVLFVFFSTYGKSIMEIITKG